MSRARFRHREIHTNFYLYNLPGIAFLPSGAFGPPPSNAYFYFLRCYLFANRSLRGRSYKNLFPLSFPTNVQDSIVGVNYRSTLLIQLEELLSHSIHLRSLPVANGSTKRAAPKAH
jgi:hypothetical protein